MVGQKHNDSVMWTSLLNKKKKTSWVAARAEALESLFPVATSPRLTGFCCHGTSQRVWWRTFYGESRGLPLSGWSTLQPRCSVLSAIWNSLLRRLSPRSLQCGGNSYTRPTQPSLPSVGEIILMCQLFHRAETWWLCGGSTMREPVAVNEPLTTDCTCE